MGNFATAEEAALTLARLAATAGPSAGVKRELKRDEAKEALVASALPLADVMALATTERLSLEESGTSGTGYACVYADGGAFRCVHAHYFAPGRAAQPLDVRGRFATAAQAALAIARARKAAAVKMNPEIPVIESLPHLPGSWRQAGAPQLAAPAPAPGPPLGVTSAMWTASSARLRAPAVKLWGEQRVPTLADPGLWPEGAEGARPAAPADVGFVVGQALPPFVLDELARGGEVVEYWRALHEVGQRFKRQRRDDDEAGAE
jgi:hypothetical protein